MQNDPLELIRYISELKFYTNSDDQINLLKELLFKGKRVIIKNINDKTILIENNDEDKSIEISTDTNYSYQIFILLKDELLLLIREKVYSDLNEEKSLVYLKLIIKELRHLQKKVNNLKSNKIVNTHLAKINAALTTLINDITDTYLPQNSIKTKEYKIKWLGTNKQLGTLIYDLWKGQRGLTKNKLLRPIIKASKQDLMQFILDNFIANDNSAFAPSSVNDYLNASESKDNQRATTDRIELDYKF